MDGGLWKLSVSLSLCLSICGSSVRGTWRGGLLYWGPLKLCRGRLWRQASLSIGAPLGNLEEGSFNRDFERWIKDGSRNGASPSVGAL